VLGVRCQEVKKNCLLPTAYCLIQVSGSRGQGLGIRGWGLEIGDSRFKIQEWRSQCGARRPGFEIADSRFKNGGVPMRSG
jgi:hypothetical protein